jgi:hypothetical protein
VATGAPGKRSFPLDIRPMIDVLSVLEGALVGIIREAWRWTERSETVDVKRGAPFPRDPVPLREEGRSGQIDIRPQTIRRLWKSTELPQVEVGQSPAYAGTVRSCLYTSTEADASKGPGNREGRVRGGCFSVRERER